LPEDHPRAIEKTELEINKYVEEMLKSLRRNILIAIPTKKKVSEMDVFNASIRSLCKMAESVSETALTTALALSGNTRPENPDHLRVVPLDIISHYLLTFVDRKSIACLMSVNKKMFEIIRDKICMGIDDCEAYRRVWVAYDSEWHVGAIMPFNDRNMVLVCTYMGIVGVPFDEVWRKISITQDLALLNRIPSPINHSTNKCEICPGISGSFKLNDPQPFDLTPIGQTKKMQFYSDIDERNPKHQCDCIACVSLSKPNISLNRFADCISWDTVGNGNTSITANRNRSLSLRDKLMAIYSGMRLDILEPAALRRTDTYEVHEFESYPHPYTHGQPLWD
jgi:hypothetical protein